MSASSEFGSSTGKTLTSHEEPIRLDPICITDSGGALYLTFAPGKKQTSIKYDGVSWDRCLDTDLHKMKNEYDIDHVVCLLEEHEFRSLQIDNYLDRVKEWGMDITHYPIRDKDIPPRMDHFHTVVTGIHSLLHDGKNIVIHCAGGVGRSGTLATGVLCISGYDPIDAIKLVQERRLNSIKRPCQQHFVCQYSYYYCL